MFEHKKINTLNDFFIELHKRPEEGIYFYRLNGYSNEIKTFIQNYYESARRAGVVIEGKIPNPDEKNLAYYNEIMGMDFQMNPAFIETALKKWLPRMNSFQRKNVAYSIYDTLDSLRKSGKNENMLKNAYIKFMCWLYYKFERIVNLLGTEKVPKILYEGEISQYELLLIVVLAKAGCDVVLLQYHGDNRYLKLDLTSQLSEEWKAPDLTNFPADFSLRQLRTQMQEAFERERLYGRASSYKNCTNAWIEGKALEDIQKDVSTRGADNSFFYNCYCLINGVEDKLTYVNQLFLFYQSIAESKRNLVAIDEKIPLPQPEEISSVRRKNYMNLAQMLLDLSSNLKVPENVELQRLLIKAFMDVMFSESKKSGVNLNRLLNQAVYLLCWTKRYQSILFKNWKMPEIACFFYMTAQVTENEALFLRMLARLPVDVLILNPQRTGKGELEDPLLYEENYSESLNIKKIPRENVAVQMGTVAYQAERELDAILYQDTGIYRNQQYQNASVINLKTTYEEIGILWKEELKYRPNFSTTQDIVNLPVIFAKVCGIKNGDETAYWTSIKELITENTFVVKHFPFLQATDENLMKPYATEFWKNERLHKNKIKNHPSYPYAMLREEMQDYILDKLEQLIKSRVISGTFENGTEYTIVSTVLNLPKEVVRLLQAFDFTKENPKAVLIHTGEKMISLEDTILTAFLNLAGFDVVFFVPTGYQSIEKYFNRKLFDEYQIGEYKYDLQIPEFNHFLGNTWVRKWRDKLLGKGV